MKSRNGKAFLPEYRKAKAVPRRPRVGTHSPLSSLFFLQTTSSLSQYCVVRGNTHWGALFFEAPFSSQLCFGWCCCVFLTAHTSKEIPAGAESIAALITPSTEPICVALASYQRHLKWFRLSLQPCLYFCVFRFCCSYILYFFIDWVDVANDLLRSCHVNQHIKHLSECGADVFVRLYESILGERVPGGNVNS